MSIVLSLHITGFSPLISPVFEIGWAEKSCNTGDFVIEGFVISG